MLRKPFIEFIMEAASIQRWNDHIRPSHGFQELDKQSHKMLYAYTLAKGCGSADRLKLIEGSIFEFLHRLILTDLKPPIFHRLMKEKGGSINRFVLASLESNIRSIPMGFYGKFEKYLTDPNYAAPEKKILEAAHYLATKWEFDIIYAMCPAFYGIEGTKKEIYDKITDLKSLRFFADYINNKDLVSFTDLVGGLRLQQRWARTPRMPQTSVMGHMYVTAALSYFTSLEVNACENRLINNFLGGLFHDLPEVLTRDIVSPVKSSVEGLDELIKDIENTQMENVIYHLIPPDWQTELDYFTQDEFLSKIKRNAPAEAAIGSQQTPQQTAEVHTSDEINDKYNSDEFSPIDGEIIRGCDHLSAFLETYLSVTCGIKSESLLFGNRSLYTKYKNRIIGGIDFGILFDYFKI